MSIDPRRIADQKDAWVTALYAKTVGQTDDDDVLPLLIDSNGYLLINMTVGTISLNTTAVTITNAVGNPANVSLTNTAVTVAGTVSLVSTQVTIGNVLTATVSSVSITASSTVTGTVQATVSSTTMTCSATIIGGNINVSSATLGTVTVVGNVNVSSATLGTVVVSSSNVTVSSISITASCTIINTLTVSSVSMTVSSVSITASSSVTGTVTSMLITGRTLTGSTGSLSATNGAITVTPTNRVKVYAISLTTTAATELIAIWNSGGVANGLELWRATLMAPAGASAGLNLAVDPPNFLFQSRSGTAVSLSLNTATLVHYSISYFDEA